MKEKIFDVPSYCQSGIYAIVNRTKMKAYIGQSNNIKYRAVSHEQGIRKGTHPIKELSEDCEDEFGFIILHKTFDESKEFMSILEKLYMLTFTISGFYLYNKNEVGFTKSSNEISHHICAEIMSHFGTKETLSDTYFEKFGNQYYYDIRKFNAKKNKLKQH